ncbi:MAG: ribosome-binding factor A, partial [Thermomicrobiales bacterium]
ALDSASGFIRRQLKPRLRMRQSPEISFLDDRSMEYAQTISTALRKIRTAEGSSDVPGSTS